MTTSFDRVAMVQPVQKWWREREIEEKWETTCQKKSNIFRIHVRGGIGIINIILRLLGM